MKCVGGRVRPPLVNNNAATTPWQDAIANAVEKLGITEPLDEPVGLQLTFTVDRPRSVTVASRPWPSKTARTSDGGGGDVDKLARTILDGLEQGGVIRNDAQVVHLSAVKAYPDSPGAVDVLERSGVFIRLYLI
jgi:Holliday junction resolvase RusA-like endonuclease